MLINYDDLPEPDIPWAEVPFEDANFQLPKCVYCDNPFSIRDGRTPYILPCKTHKSCKECLKLARANIDKIPNLACPIDGQAVDVKLVKNLNKDLQILKLVQQAEDF